MAQIEYLKFLADVISTGFEAEMGIWKQNWNFIFRIEIRYIVAVVLCQLPLKVSFRFLLHFKFGSWYTVFHIGKHIGKLSHLYASGTAFSVVKIQVLFPETNGEEKKKK